MTTVLTRPTTSTTHDTTTSHVGCRAVSFSFRDNQGNAGDGYDKLDQHVRSGARVKRRPLPCGRFKARPRYATRNLRRA